MAAPLKHDIALSVLDQLPFMRTYTQMLLCFPVTSEIDRPQIIEILRAAAAALINAVPILGGQVVNRKDDEVQVPTSGTFLVAPYNHPAGSPVIVKVLDDFISYDELCDSAAPASLLDGTLLAPMKGYPDHYGDSDITPVLLIQANFIPGGLLLCFAGQPLSKGDLEVANTDRAQLPVSLKEGQTPMQHPEMTPKPKAEEKSEPTDSAAAVWSCFSIPPARLKHMKTEVSEHLVSGWVSTNDIVTAWLWKLVAKAKRPDTNPRKGTTLLRAVTGRRVLDPPLPGNYLGANVMCAFHKVNVTDLINQPLTDVTQAVRKATATINDHYVRSIATLIRNEPDRNKIALSFNAPDGDFLVSSWASLPVYEDFGTLIGRPDYLRRPTCPPWVGVCYIMPKRPDGSFELLLSLAKDDMERLRDDEDFTAVAEWIG